VDKLELALYEVKEGVIKFPIFRSMGSTGVFYRKFGIFCFIPVSGPGDAGLGVAGLGRSDSMEVD
jgi:hypothetical protein